MKNYYENWKAYWRLGEAAGISMPLGWLINIFGYVLAWFVFRMISKYSVYWIEYIGDAVDVVWYISNVIEVQQTGKIIREKGLQAGFEHVDRKYGWKK